MKFPCLLITTAINPVKINYLKMTNPKKRLDWTIKAINYWKVLIPNIKIVVVDGTNFDLNPYLDKNIECLFYSNSLKTKGFKGKGSGEAEDIIFALTNSSTINNNPHVMKITGKYWVENIHKFKQKDLFCDFKCKPVISNFLSLEYISTIFMCFHKDFYLSKFKDLQYLINDSIHFNDIEHIMANEILEKKIKNFILSEIPLVKGWCGTGDHLINLYTDSRKHFFRRYKYKLLSKIF